MRAVVALLWVIGFASRAEAAEAWYFKWNCTGQCSPGELAITGIEGPYATKDECESARWDHPNRLRTQEPGNVGSNDFCYNAIETDGSASAPPRKPLALSKFAAGIVAGGAWTATEPGGVTTAGPSRTYGLELELDFGSPFLAFEATAGLWSAELDAAAFGDGTKRTNLVPFVIGFQSTPVALVRGRSVEIRPDLGAGFAFLWTGTCSYCTDKTGSTDIGWRAKVGLDIYVGKQPRPLGIAVDLLITHLGAGDVMDDVLPSAVEVRAPTYLVRVGIIGRNPNLLGW